MSSSQFALRPIDGGKNTILPIGSTSIGRGPLLSVCTNLMYNWGALVENYCFRECALRLQSNEFNKLNLLLLILT